MPAEAGRDAGLVDRLGYRSDVYDELEKRLGETTPLLAERYVRRGPRTLKDVRDSLPWPQKPVVAVIRISGGINVGRNSGGGPLGGPSSGSDTIGAALRAVADDDKVRAVVLRIDSPGGSYVASDAIRHEVLRLRATGRPVIASMGSVAASGGYFVAMPADVIVAQPGTITGSIGVLSGKGVVRDALGRIGISQEAVSQGQNARMYSAQEEFSPEQWERLEESLDRIYEDFVAKAAQDRGLPVADLEALARGRVWTGADAQERKLVDEPRRLRARPPLGLQPGRPGPRPHRRHRSAPAQLPGPAEAPESTEDLAAQAKTVSLTDGLTSAVYTALGLPPTGVLTMPMTWRLT